MSEEENNTYCHMECINYIHHEQVY